MFYIKDLENNIIIFDESKQKIINTQEFMPEYKDFEILETKENETIVDFQLMTIDEAKAKEEQQEAERIAKLNLTRGDVFRGIYQAKQISRADLREMIVRNETVSMFQKELALIDFDEALNFYRGNPLIDLMGASIGLTKEQLDRFFETNDYHELETVEPEPTTPIVE